MRNKKVCIVDFLRQDKIIDVIGAIASRYVEDMALNGRALGKGRLRSHLRAFK